MADSVGGTSRSRLVWPAIFLGCCSAGLIWLLYALYGHLLVQGMYDRTLPFEWLNGIVKRQTRTPWITTWSWPIQRCEECVSC